jgi:8-amino-7-oxononanoate synthase
MQDQRHFSNLKSPLGPKIYNDDQEYLYFGGTAYLGIPQHEGFLNLYLEGLKKFGLNNGTSRSNNVQLGIYQEVEAYAAKRFDAAAALITSSGFLAAQFLVKHLSNYGEISYAPATHPALWLNDAPQSSGSFTHWAERIVTAINASKAKKWVLISNSMNNLYPEIYDFSFVEKIHPSKDVILVVDDSHGIGVNNNGLSALSSILAPKNVKVVLIASMAKALGIDAGLILGNEEFISALKESNAFFGASPPSAAGLYAFMEGEHIYNSELAKLKSLTSILGQALSGNPDWHFIPGFPVFFSKNADLSLSLFEKRILVSSFPYPDKHGAIVNRIVLSSWHTANELETLVNSLI